MKMATEVTYFPSKWLHLFPTKELLLLHLGAANESSDAEQETLESTVRLGRDKAFVRPVWQRISYWSDRLNCQIGIAEPGEVFLILKAEADCCQVLFDDGIFWIKKR